MKTPSIKRFPQRALVGATTAAILLGGVGTATMAEANDSADVVRPAVAPALVSDPQDSDLARDFQHLDRNTNWKLASKIKFNFPTYHTEGLAVTPNRLFLSAVQIVEPTKKYPTPVNGYDRTPGKGIGHLFVTDRAGNLQKDLTFADGDVYHPGGIDFDGQNIWLPVAQYRPNSSAAIYRVDAQTLSVTKEFTFGDHIGGIVFDRQTKHLIGNNWGSRRFYEWSTDGKQITSWDNRSYLIDYQDCQYVVERKMLCGGVTNLPQTPTAGGSSATYELGGMALTDLRTHEVSRELPLQLWSTAGHVITRNPFKMAANGDEVTFWAAPDNGDEGNGTELFMYQTTVSP